MRYVSTKNGSNWNLYGREDALEVRHQSGLFFRYSAVLHCVYQYGSRAAAAPNSSRLHWYHFSVESAFDAMKMHQYFSDMMQPWMIQTKHIPHYHMPNSSRFIRSVRKICCILISCRTLADNCRAEMILVLIESSWFGLSNGTKIVFLWYVSTKSGATPIRIVFSDILQPCWISILNSSDYLRYSHQMKNVDRRHTFKSLVWRTMNYDKMWENIKIA